MTFPFDPLDAPAALTRRQRVAACRKFAVRDYIEADEKAFQPEWRDYWMQYSWYFLLAWAALKEDML